MTTNHCYNRYVLAILLTVSIAWSQQRASLSAAASQVVMKKLPDTGQTTSYTSTFGEDADYSINIPSFTANGDGTVIDNTTGLMWQQTDGGEMSIEKATVYCDTLTLAGYTDWRLPTGLESFSILNHDKLNPAMDVTYFPKTTAEYWWTGERRADDATKVWATNAGGGIGAHPKSETISAGGTKHFHVRAVRTVKLPASVSSRFVDNGNGTVTDRSLGLMWQKIQPAETFAWEKALAYSESLSLGGYTDWRLPNINELNSLNDASLTKPSIDKTVFPSAVIGRYWSSTSQFNTAANAWFLDAEFGIVSYDAKTVPYNLFCVRGSADGAVGAVNEVLIPGGEFEMGDHFGFVDPSHPSDELPLHVVKVSSFYMSATETSNKQCVDLLNFSYAKGSIEVRGNIVFLAGGTDTLCLLNSFASYSSIGWDGKQFSVVDFRADHPLVGIMWNGAAMLCNMFSLQNGLEECYDLKMGTCDFTKSGYRMPTEAEWEYAGRGGNIDPYLNYPKGNTITLNAVNLPASGDPYETGSYPNTTPVGFYDGTLKLKSVYNWPGSATSYQTSDGANAFGLYDMQGNVWEFVNDWYGQNYYSSSPYDNPKGPLTGFIMPDGKPYRGMRGGNWYNGLVVSGVNDGHSRVSNRNPSYYRGPQDPNHPYYHLGFRAVRKYSGSTGVNQTKTFAPESFHLSQNYPNPFNPATAINYRVPSSELVTMKIYDALGREITTMVNEVKDAGQYSVQWNASGYSTGIYFATMSAGKFSSVIKLVLMK